MSNDYYTETGAPGLSAPFSSTPLKSEFVAVGDAFDKLPALTGNGGKLVAINAGETAQEAVSTLASLTITNFVAGDTDAVDLVDAGNALNVGNVAGAHLAASPDIVQAKSNPTTATDLNLNPLGGAVIMGYGGATALETQDYGAKVSHTSGDTPAVNLYSSGDVALGQIYMGTGGAGLRVRSLVDSAHVYLEAFDAGSNTVSVVRGDPDGYLTLFNSGDARARIAATGIESWNAARGAGGYEAVAVSRPYASKTIDDPKTSDATPALDTDLRMTIPAGKYAVEGYLRMSRASVNMDGVQLQFPTTNITDAYYTGYNPIEGVATHDGVAVSLDPLLIGEFGIVLHGSFTASGTATFGVMWAQETSHADALTMLANSWLKLTRTD